MVGNQWNRRVHTHSFSSLCYLQCFTLSHEYAGYYFQRITTDSLNLWFWRLTAHLNLKGKLRGGNQYVIHKNDLESRYSPVVNITLGSKIENHYREIMFCAINPVFPLPQYLWLHLTPILSENWSSIHWPNWWICKGRHRNSLQFTLALCFQTPGPPGNWDHL